MIKKKRLVGIELFFYLFGYQIFPQWMKNV